MSDVGQATVTDDKWLLEPCQTWRDAKTGCLGLFSCLTNRSNEVSALNNELDIPTVEGGERMGGSGWVNFPLIRQVAMNDLYPSVLSRPRTLLIRTRIQIRLI